MRKFFLLTIALIAFTACANGQMQSLAGINYFYSMNTISADSAIDKITQMEPGYGFGVVYKHTELANIIGVQVEANYERQGFTIKPNAEQYYTQYLRYLTIPVYAHVDIGKNAVKGLFAIGAYGSFLLEKEPYKANFRTFGDNSWALQRIHYSKYKNFTYGLCGQVGFAVCTKVGVFEVMGRANIGMSRMMDIGKLWLMHFVSMRSFQGGVSYLVPFGGGDKYWTKREKIRKLEPIESVPADMHTQEEPSDAAGSDELQPEESSVPADEEENWEERM